MNLHFRTPHLLLAVLATAFVASAKPVIAETRSVLRNAQDRVVKLFGAGGISGLEAYQTGVLVSAEGHIVTVNSTVLDAGDVTVVMVDGARRSGLVVGAHPVADLALLKIDPAGETLPFYDLTSPSEAQTGQPIWALANEFGIATGDEPVTVLHGVVAAIAPLRVRRGVDGAEELEEAILLDAVTSNPGAAGGAVIDRRGRLLGVLGRERRSTLTGAWVSHATPTDSVRRVVQQILDNEVAERGPRAPRTVDLLATWGFVLTPEITPRTPPYVDYVRPGSAADTAGVRADDLIVMWRGRVGSTCREVHRLANEAAARSTVPLTVQRGDELIDFVIKSPATPREPATPKEEAPSARRR